MHTLKISLLFYIKQSNCLHDCNKHWTLFQNCEIHGARRWGSIDYRVMQYMHQFSTNFLPWSWVFSPWTKYKVIMRKSASSKIVNFLAPGSGVMVYGWSCNDYIVKTCYSLEIKRLLLNIRQTNDKYIVKMRKSAFSKINFMAPGWRVLELW